MPTFSYKAMGPDSAVVQGTISAPSRKEALQQLLQRGQSPMDLREGGKERGDSKRAISFRRNRDLRLATFTRQLATLSASGIPIIKGLNVLIDQTRHARTRAILEDVRESVHSGSTFADALGAFPEIFPTLMTSMVRVGETSGTLDEQLTELSELYEREEMLRGEVQAALAYPMLVLGMGVLSTIVLVGFFIPRLKGMFEGVGEDLPLPTRMLIGMSDFVTDHAWVLCFLAIVLLVGCRYLMRFSQVRMALDQLKLSMPWIGNLLVNVEIARFARLLGTLCHAGVLVVDALKIVQPVLGNRVVSAAVTDIATRVRTGERFATLMKESALFPPLSVQMVAVGEETGHLDKMLLSVADAYDRETTAATKVITSMLAPFLILVVAAMVGFILISMMLPIFQLSTVIR